MFTDDVSLVCYCPLMQRHLLPLTALPLTWGLALSCNETAFAECWKTLESYMSDAQVLFPVYDDATLQEVCR